MNKKVLTISTGMLLSTALAFSAINPTDLKVVSADDFVSGNNYYVVADVTGDGLTADDILLSLQSKSGALTGEATAALNSASFDTKGISFKITEVPSQSIAGNKLYTLYSNDAEAYLAFDANNAVIGDPEKTDAGVGHMWAFNDGTAASNIAKYAGPTANYLNNNAGGHYNLGLSTGKIDPVGGTTGASKILFCEADRAVVDTDLNDFFNNKGFNLAVEYDSENYTLDENFFGGDSRIWAFEVKSGNCDDATNNWVAGKGYKLSKAGANGEDLYIPEGMYFFTERVLKSGVDATTGLKAENIDWLKSTLIYVSPTKTVETTVDDRDEGQGFQLMTAKVSDFIFEDNVSDYKVGTCLLLMLASM